MEQYILIGLLLALMVLIYFKQPKKLYGVVVQAVVANIKKNEAFIVQGLYNLLPSDIKKQLGSKQVANIVGYALKVITDILEESVSVKKK